MKEPIFKPDFKDAERLKKELSKAVKLAGIENTSYEMGFEHGFEVCREQIEKLVESAPVVYGWCDDAGHLTYGTEGGIADTHSAILLFIEPIEVKECKSHEPSVIMCTINGVQTSAFSKKCKHCDKTIVQKWETVK